MTQDKVKMESQARELLLAHGWMVLRINHGTGRGNIAWAAWWSPTEQTRHDDGISDLIAFKRGETRVIETKTPGDKLRPSQVEFLTACNERGIEVWVIDNLDDLETALESFDRKMSLPIR